MKKASLGLKEAVPRVPMSDKARMLFEKSSQTLGIEPDSKQYRLLGSLSLLGIIWDKAVIVNKCCLGVGSVI